MIKSSLQKLISRVLLTALVGQVVGSGLLGGINRTQASGLLQMIPGTVIENSSLIATEILPTPSSGNEFIEFYNTSSSSLDVSSWTLSDITDITMNTMNTIYVFSANKIIAPHSYFAAEITGNHLNADTDKVIVTNENGELQAEYQYNGGTTSDHYSLARHEDGVGIGTWDETQYITKGEHNDFDGVPEAITTQDNINSTLGQATHLVSLDWSGYIAPSDFDHYQILNNLNVPIGTSTVKSWTDTQIRPAGNFVYKIKVWDKSGNFSIVTGSTITILIPTNFNLTTTWQNFADNFQAKSNIPQGSISVEKVNNADVPPYNHLQDTVKTLGGFWKVDSLDTDSLFTNGNKLSLRIWFTQADLDVITPGQDQAFGIYYYSTTDLKWVTFAETGKTLDPSRSGYLGYVWANSDHLTDISGVGDITKPTVAIDPLGELKTEYTTETVDIPFRAIDTDSGIDSVKVVYSLNGAEYIDGDSLKVESNNNDVTSTLVFNASHNGDYVIKLVATDKGGNASDYSNTKSFTISVAPPAAPTNVTLSYNDGKLLISWGKVVGAKGYRVYIGASSNPITATLVREVNSNTFEIEQSVRPGKKYFIFVYAVGFNTLLSPASAPFEISVPAVVEPEIVYASAPVAITTTPSYPSSNSVTPTPTTPEISPSPEASPEASSSGDSSTNKIMIIAIVLILAAGAGIGGYYGYLWWQEKNMEDDQPAPIKKASATPVKSKTSKTTTKRKSTRW